MKEKEVRIIKAYEKIVKPWISIGIEPPSVQVKELARTAGIPNPAVLANNIIRENIVYTANDSIGKKLVLRDSNDDPLESTEDLNKAAMRVAPYKRAVQETGYRAKAPGGGPIIKRRVIKKELEKKLLQLGKSKLTVYSETYSKITSKEKRKQEIEKKLEARWIGKSSTEDPATITANETLATIKKLSERLGETNEAEILKRLIRNIENNLPQTILTIWGPPYEGQGNTQSIFDKKSPEKRMAKSLIETIRKLSENMDITFLILYADIYGTNINEMPQGEVEKYGNQIKNRFQGIGEFINWSDLKSENIKKIPPQLDISPNREEINRAIIIQKKLGNQVNISEAEELARMYKVERMTEGLLLSSGFTWKKKRFDNIIKLGTAPSKLSDDPYESELPRFYVSEMPRAAWNTPR